MTITSREALPSSQLKGAWMAYITKTLSGLIGIGLSCVSKNCWFKNSWKHVLYYLITLLIQRQLKTCPFLSNYEYWRY